MSTITVNAFATESRDGAVAELLESLNAAERQLAQCRETHARIDAQRQALEAERAQFAPLDDACESIEALFAANLSRTFWGERASDEAVRAHLAQVRKTLSVTGEQLRAVGEQLKDAGADVQRAELRIFDLEDALELARDEADSRRREWQIERQETPQTAHDAVLPWNRKQEEDRRFRRSLMVSLLLALAVGIVMPLIDLPIPERAEEIEVPERLVTMIRKHPVTPIPAAAPIPKAPEPVREPELVKPEPQEPVQVAEKVLPEAVPEQPQPTAREKVASAGLLAFRERLANVASNRPTAQLGQNARINDAGTLTTGLPERSMITTSGPGSSGGINLAALSRNVGTGAGAGDQITGTALTRAASSIAGGGSDRPLSQGASAGRTDEEIQIVFDRHKAALYRLYNKELRKDPTLRGQLVLRLTIEPDGSVSLCRMESTELNAPTLTEDVVQQVRGFDFGAKEVPPVTIIYPIDFLPTA